MSLSRLQIKNNKSHSANRITNLFGFQKQKYQCKVLKQTKAYQILNKHLLPHYFIITIATTLLIERVPNLTLS